MMTLPLPPSSLPSSRAAMRPPSRLSVAMKLDGAFDSGEALNQGLLAGDVQGLVVQNPMRMGYLGVMKMVAVLRGEKVDARIDTGVGFVTKANFHSPEMAVIVRPPLDKYLK